MYSSISCLSSLEKPEITLSEEVLNSWSSRSSLTIFLWIALVISWLLCRFDGIGLCLSSTIEVMWVAMQASQNFLSQQSIELFFGQSSQMDIFIVMLVVYFLLK